MLKLTEDLFRIQPSAELADYYERTVYNHILSTQHPVNGGYVYFTPVRPRHYRVYSTPNEAMWCCVGSGLENHSKYNEFIYSQKNDSLFLNLFIASELNWAEKGIRIRQETSFPNEEQTRLKVTEGSSKFTWMIRYPSWVKKDSLKIRINGKDMSFMAVPSSYIAICRTWKKGDVLEIILPMHNHIEYLPNVPNYIAILHGPILLAARTGTEDLKGLVADNSRWGHIASGEKLPIDKAPIIIESNLEYLSKMLEPIPGKPLTFTTAKIKIINAENLVLEPFYQIHDSRYMMYWMALSGRQYQSYLDSLGALEREKLALQKRTIDFVAPGEQQPEADHAMQTDHSRSGSLQNEFWRDAVNGGSFSYQLATSNETGLSLMVRYWGAEWGNRKFDIFIDDKMLASEDNTGRWNQSRFINVVYNIPDSMIQGKKFIRVKFQSKPQNTAGAVYYLRLLKKDENSFPLFAGEKQAHNPIIFADVPDMSIIRVGDTYYMSSTTMHMSPGLPIMKSTDLVNWKMVNYAYDTLANMDELNLDNGKSTYGRGSWASCIRYHKGTYYVTTFAQTTGKSYIFSTKNLETGPWKVSSFKPSYHDHTLFFDDDGRVYLIYGAGQLRLVELNANASAVKQGTEEKVIIENASAPAGTNIMLNAEGSQLFKVKGKYYLFNIVWPRNGMRTVLIHRADKITGPWEGRVALQDLGVAQGGLIDTPDGNWYAYLFRDYGAVGRIPYLVPVKWIDGWPVLGVDGRVPEILNLPPGKGLIPGIVASDEFTRKKGDPAFPLVWQWNHNPDNSHWSLHKREGYFSITTSRIDTSIYLVKNVLTQRTIGPECTGSTKMDVSKMKEGDFAGLALFQKKYGQVGVQFENGVKSVVMISAESEKPVEMQRIPLAQNTVYLKAECNFKDKADIATFFYSLDGIKWETVGSPLQMKYTLPHFMGYRFGLFNYANKTTGGAVDFDFFHISNQVE
jgi:beta-xylosidase